MAKKIKVVGNRNLTDRNATGSPFDSISSNSFFTLGDFTATTNIVPRSIREYDDKFFTVSSFATLESLGVNDLSFSDELINTKSTIVLNYDKSNLNNYAYFGSLSERLKTAISNITTTWLGSLYVDPLNSGAYYNSVQDYDYNEATDIASFKVPTFLIKNVFGVSFVKGNESVSDIYDLNISYEKYVIYIDGVEYPITAYTPPINNLSGFLYFTVDGNPFPSASGGTSIENYHIKPNIFEFNKWYNTLDNLEKYLLTLDSLPKYTASFKIPQKDLNKKTYFVTKDLTWSTSDGYNIDVNNSNFSNYYNSLVEVGDVYDNFKTDLVFRYLTVDSLKDYDQTENLKLDKLLRIYGRELDEIKSFIDGLSYINTVTYDKKDNIPDILVKNLARTLGWDVFEILSEDDFVNSVFSANNGEDKSILPYEIDIELWRRIIINTSWLFKSKGTRKAIEFILKFIGAPDCLVDINEHIYTVDGVIDVSTVDLSVLGDIGEDFSTLPYDSDGYPQAPNELNNFFFQISGDSDSGQAYIDMYRNLGFNVTKQIDNRKVWVKDEVVQRVDVELSTNYTQTDSKLILNTKEISVDLDIAKAIECDIYDYNKDNNYPVTDDISKHITYPYPNDKYTVTNVSGLTFIEYINEVQHSFIDVKNRKVIDDGRGGGYPALSKLYQDYLKRSLSEGGVQSMMFKFSDMLDYVNKLDDFWNRFVSQLLPATVIVGSSATRIRNTIFTPQKFVYKHGINDSSEFQVVQPVASESNTEINKVTLSINDNNEGNYKVYESSGTFGELTSSGGTSGNLTYVKDNIGYNNLWSYQAEGFDVPQYFMTGATKILSAVTTDAIHYFENETEKDLYFEFTGNTASLTGSNFTFTYDIYKYEETITGFTATTSFTNSFTNAYFSGSGITISDTVDNSYLEADAEYLIKGTFYKSYPNINSGETITTITPLDYYDYFHETLYPELYSGSTFYFDRPEYSGLTGFTLFNGLDLTLTYDLPYLIYEEDFDWYFVSLNNSQTPIITNTLETNTENPMIFVTETITVTSGMTDFVINSVPNGEVQVAVNGLTLLPNVEYSAATALPSNQAFSMVDPLLETDVLTVSYITNGIETTFNIDYINVSGITNAGDVAPSGVTVAYNTGTSKYELYLDFVPASLQQIQVNYNGSTLYNGVDFILSTLVPNKLILNFVIYVGDLFTVYYVQDDSVIIPSLIITTNPFTFTWNVLNPIPEDQEDGYFELQFADQLDTDFTTILYSATTDYVVNETNYTNEIDFTTTPLIFGETYSYRIKSVRYYTTIGGAVIETVAYSNLTYVKIET